MKKFIVRIYTKNLETYRYNIYALNYTNAKRKAFAKYLNNHSGDSISMITADDADIIAEDYLT